MGTALLAKYSSMRKYFSLFVRLRFAVQKGSAFLLEAIEIVRALDDGTLKKLPKDSPRCFVPRFLRKNRAEKGNS